MAAKVLVADDDPLTRHFLSDALKRWGYEVEVVADGRAAREVLERPNAPRMVILDWMMPGPDGVELTKLIRKRRADVYTYILMLTVRDQKKDVVAGFDAGVDDYLSKPFDEDELKGRVRAGVRMLEVQDQLLEARESYRAQAEHDDLTGLWNRKAALDALQRELDRSRRSKSPVGVVLVDLDHFKTVNDTRGHAAGDAVLREVAGRFSSTARSYDTVGRYGGEEFLFVLADCDLEGARKRAEILRTSIGSEPIKLSEGLTHVTLSAGVSSSAGKGRNAAAALLAAADRALYRAKHLGRNRVEVATDC